MGLDVPLAGLAWCVRGRAAFTRIAFMFAQVGDCDLVIAPARGQCRQRLLGGLGCREALRLQVKELLVDGLVFALSRFVDRRLGTRKGSLRIDHQPALGHASVA